MFDIAKSITESVPQPVWEDAVLARETVRSGESIRYPGHIVVLADVHVGAEIVAAGDILVWGRLDGAAHAGSDGDPGAVVGALELNPSQLRIGNGFTRVSLREPSRRGKPKIARVCEDRIIVEAWDSTD